MAAKAVVPIVVIVGETASGKSDLGMFLAEKFNGEIIAADSRTIYKGMDIGTAKPSLEDRARIPHHLLDMVEPGERYTAAQFKEDALLAIDDISSRGRLPIIIGGTGLYVDSIIFNYDFGTEDVTRRLELNELSLEELQVTAEKSDISREAVDFKNRRHLQRAVERGRAGHFNQELRENTLVLGVKRGDDELNERIEARITHMLEAGFIDEVKKLVDKYGSKSEAMTGIGYRAFTKYISGDISLAEAKAEFIQGDKKLAKRQRTWFKRNKSIHYPLKQSESVDLVTTLLSK